MNMFARFIENPAMTLQDIKETKRYGRTDARTDGQRENSTPHHKQSLRGGIKIKESALEIMVFVCLFYRGSYMSVHVLMN